MEDEMRAQRMEKPQAQLALRSTKTNPQTGESETWEYTTGNAEPVAKTLPEVTVTYDKAPERTEAERVIEANSEANMDKMAAKRNALLYGALEKYGDDYQDIWKRGGRRRIKK